MPALSFDPLSDSAGGADAARILPVGAGDALAGLVDLALEPTVEVALRAVREMLGMEVAYMSQIVGGDMVLRQLEGDGESFGMTAGLALPLEQTYCQRMLDGRIPNLIPNVLAEDRVASLPITQVANIGAFATVPLTFSNGSAYGTLCAASHDAKSLGYRDLQFLQVFARLIANQLERESAALAFRELAALVNAADDAITGVTLAGVVTSWNAACERMFGYPASEAIGRNIVDLVAPPGEEEGMRGALTAVAAGEVVHVEARRLRSDGVIIDTAATVSPIYDEQGAVSLISGVVRDISAQVRQARFRVVEREVISALASANDAAEAALGTLRAVGEGLDCDFGVVWEVDGDGEALRCTDLWVREVESGALCAGDARALLWPWAGIAGTYLGHWQGRLGREPR